MREVIQQFFSRRFLSSLVVLAAITFSGLASAQSTITYEMAEQAMAAALAEARANDWNLTIVIADAEGLPVMIHRMDGASPRSYTIALAKAKVVTETGLLTGEYGRLLREGEIEEVEGGVTFAGGVPVMLNGERIGAITSSGARGSEDEQVSLAAAAAIGD